MKSRGAPCLLHLPPPDVWQCREPVRAAGGEGRVTPQSVFRLRESNNYTGLAHHGQHNTRIIITPNTVPWHHIDNVLVRRTGCQERPVRHQWDWDTSTLPATARNIVNSPSGRGRDHCKWKWSWAGFYLQEAAERENVTPSDTLELRVSFVIL